MFLAGIWHHSISTKLFKLLNGCEINTLRCPRLISGSLAVIGSHNQKEVAASLSAAGY